MTSERESYVLNKQRAAELEQRSRRICELNDDFRRTFTGGYVMITLGVRELGVAVLAAVVNAVRNYADFSEANDPYQEHDFGSIEIGGHRIFWKIDYLDLQLEFGSPDPARPDLTARVLTIMLAEEY